MSKSTSPEFLRLGNQAINLDEVLKVIAPWVPQNGNSSGEPLALIVYKQPRGPRRQLCECIRNRYDVTRLIRFVQEQS